MTTYTITFDAPSFRVATDAKSQLGIAFSFAGVVVEGSGEMAVSLSVNGQPAHLRLVAYGASPTRNKLPVPAGTVASWSGFNDAVASHTVDDDGLGCTLTPLAEGMFRVSAAVDGFAPASVDVTVGPEKVDHFEIEVG